MADTSKSISKLPIPVQLILGILGLVLIAAVGFAIFFACDILLLDYDPIGKLASFISSKVHEAKTAAMFAARLFC